MYHPGRRSRAMCGETVPIWVRSPSRSKLLRSPAMRPTIAGNDEAAEFDGLRLVGSADGHAAVIRQS